MACNKNLVCRWGPRTRILPLFCRLLFTKVEVASGALTKLQSGEVNIHH